MTRSLTLLSLLSLSLLLCVASAGWAQARCVSSSRPSLHSIERPNRNPPTANTHIIYDDCQILVVDTGKVYGDVVEIRRELDSLMASGERRLNAVFLTHGHPDHVAQAYALQAWYGVPIFVASEEIRQETVNLMQIFGFFLNMSSPGNPDGSAANKFNYNSRSNIKVLESAHQLWTGDHLLVYMDRDTAHLAETNHYSWIEFHPDGGAGEKISADRALQQNEGKELWVISGDLVYVNTHVYMGFDLSLQAQCDWQWVLKKEMSQRYALHRNVTLLPGHGPSTEQVGEAISAHLSYMEFAREVFISTCSAAEAQQRILGKFAHLNDPLLLTELTIPYRVPGDALNLGCACTSTPPPTQCQTTNPPCFPVA